MSEPRGNLYPATVDASTKSEPEAPIEYRLQYLKDLDHTLIIEDGQPIATVYDVNDAASMALAEQFNNAARLLLHFDAIRDKKFKVPQENLDAILQHAIAIAKHAVLTASSLDRQIKAEQEQALKEKLQQK